MIWLIGSQGMLGKEVADALTMKDIEFFPTDIEVDITDLNSLREFAKGKNITKIINCSAYTAVDQAEDEKEKAFKINVDGVKNISHISREKRATFIHISSDYVFDGDCKAAYEETDLTNPLSIYGKTKLEGEKKIEDICTRFFIIRISWLYGKYGKNFVSTMIDLMEQKEEIKVVNDQVGSPTNTQDLAKVLIFVAQSAVKKYGIYHYSNYGQISWFDFASEIYRLGRKYELIKSPCKIIPCSSKAFKTKATRPQNSLMSKEKIKETFGVQIKNWKESLERYLCEI